MTLFYSKIQCRITYHISSFPYSPIRVHSLSSLAFEELNILLNTRPVFYRMALSLGFSDVHFMSTWRLLCNPGWTWTHNPPVMASRKMGRLNSRSEERLWHRWMPAQPTSEHRQYWSAQHLWRHSPLQPLQVMAADSSINDLPASLSLFLWGKSQSPGHTGSGRELSSCGTSELVPQ